MDKAKQKYSIESQKMPAPLENDTEHMTSMWDCNMQFCLKRPVLQVYEIVSPNGYLLSLNGYLLKNTGQQSVMVYAQLVIKSHEATHSVSPFFPPPSLWGMGRRIRRM